MNFQVIALEAAQFSHLFGLSDEELAAVGVERHIVTDKPGFPCRVSLRDAEPGETVLLMNFTHLDAATPYRSSHAIFVGEHSRPATLAVNEIPESISCRLISARAFDSKGTMMDAAVVEGTALAPIIQKMFESESVACIHLHNAGRGCYAARVERVQVY